jgi:histidinol dehydrogenase
MAKRLLFGHVAVDLLPGPSEVLVLADDSADARLVAADMLAQAEHGSGHERVWLVTTSSEVLSEVRRQIRLQLPARSRRTLIQQSLDEHGHLILVENVEQAIRTVNRLAPEHCEVHTRQPQRMAAQIVTAGALFLGPWSPTVVGDYLAGPSHTLPTGGAGVSFAGLTVDQFQRRTSVVRYGRGALKASLATLQEFADREGLEAHGYSAAVRFTIK